MPERGRAADAVIEPAIGAFNAGRYAQAVRLFSGVLRRDPGRAQARVFRGLAALKQAQALMDSGAGAAARARIAAAVRRDPDVAAVRLEAARLLQRLGDFEGALAQLGAAIAKDSRVADAFEMRAVVLMHLGLEREALEASVRALRLDPGRTPLRLLAAELSARSGSFAEGLRQAAEAARRDPRSALARVASAQIRLWNGETALAVADAAAGLALDPACLEALLIRGAARVLQGRAQDALADLERASALPLPEARLWLAEAQWRLGRTAQALESVDAGLRLRGDYLAGHILRALFQLELGLPVWRESWRHVRACAPRGLAGPGPLAGGFDARAARESLLRLLKSLKGNRWLAADKEFQPRPKVSGRDEEGRRASRGARVSALDFLDPLGLAAALLTGPTPERAEDSLGPGVYSGKDNGMSA